VADYSFTRRFLEELSTFEKSASPNDLRMLEEVLAAIVDNPHMPRQVPSFYDPTSPSYLYRSGKILIHFRVPKPETVEFVNLFWPKV
jgi:hypothetical protein